MRSLEGSPSPKPGFIEEIIMLDNFLNSSVFALIVAIAGAVASANFQDSPPHVSGADSKHVATSATVAEEPAQAMVFGADASIPVVDLPVPVLQLPTVVVVAPRVRASEPTSVAAAN
jgi:hypothetical protein